MLNAGKILVRALAGAALNSAAAPVSFNECEHPLPGPHAAHIPNVAVHTHQGQMMRFYDDLIWKKIVLINCTSVRDEANHSNLETIAQVQPLIGEELGRNVFIYSITTDPESDTPAALRGLAEKYQARNGWLFLTGESSRLKLVRERLFSHSGGQDSSMHLIRYGNEAVGLWGGIPVKTTPELIAQRLSWVTPRERPSGPPKRGGPPPLTPEMLAAHNSRRDQS